MGILKLSRILNDSKTASLELSRVRTDAVNAAALTKRDGGCNTELLQILCDDLSAYPSSGRHRVLAHRTNLKVRCLFLKF